MNNKIGQNDNLFNLLVYRSIYDGEHPSLCWVSTSTAFSLAKVSDDWLHPSNRSTHPSIPGQVSDEDWMDLTSFWTDVFLKGFTSSITYLIFQAVVWGSLEKPRCSWWKSTLRSCGACSLMLTLLMFLVTMGTSVCAWLHVYVCATEELKLYRQSDNESYWIILRCESKMFMREEISWTQAWLIRPEW